MTHVHHAERERQAGEPGRAALQEPRQLVHAAVEEGVARDRVAALGRQGLQQRQVVHGPVRAAAANLPTKAKRRIRVPLQVHRCWRGSDVLSWIT